jgi:ribosomal protein S18 acetylase RimI-like enzyme|tara:strand:+ start:16622 stop:17242 length:621 start_codon:yes stop_codon:yes gene_type:complete
MMLAPNGEPAMIEFRDASVAELDNLKTFLFEHGPNPWNHLPVAGVDEELALIAQGKASALMAVEQNELLGFAIFYHSDTLPSRYLQYTGGQQPAIYISEVVVHKAHAGQGIGNQLLIKIIERENPLMESSADAEIVAGGAEADGAGMIAGAKETTALLIDRHEENLASAGMMRKAGFVTLKTYLDLERRDYGSRKTTVMAYGLNGD